MKSNRSHQSVRPPAPSRAAARLLPALVGALLVGLSAAASAQPRAAGEPVRISGEQAFMNPSWSPDGAHVAFTGDRYAGLYVLDVASGEVRQISDDPGAGFGFAWSPDGGRIVARVARFDGPRRRDAVKLFDVRDGGGRLLTDFRGSMPALPAWDAPGARVFLYADQGLEVFEVAPDAAGKGGPERPEVAVGEGGIVRARLSARTASPVETAPEGPVINLVRSPDGARVAFEIVGGNLFAMNADGTGVVDLGPGHRPDWSHDGAWIVYTRTEDDGHRFTASDLYAVRPDGTGRARITDTPERLEMNPSWAPDGTRIVYDDLADGALYVLPVTY